MLKARHLSAHSIDAAGANLMTAASCRLTSEACADRLLDLDPTGTLINAAQSNYRDLAAHSYSEAIASWDCQRWGHRSLRAVPS